MALSGVRSSWLMVARKADLARLASSAFLAFFLGLVFLALQIGDQAVLLRLEDQHVAGGFLKIAGHQQEEGLERHDGAAQRQIDRFGFPHAAQGHADGQNAGSGNQHRHETVDDEQAHRDHRHDRGDEIDLLHAAGVGQKTNSGRDQHTPVSSSDADSMPIQSRGSSWRALLAEVGIGTRYICMPWQPMRRGEPADC